MVRIIHTFVFITIFTFDLIYSRSSSCGIGVSFIRRLRVYRLLRWQWDVFILFVIFIKIYAPVCLVSLISITFVISIILTIVLCVANVTSGTTTITATDGKTTLRVYIKLIVLVSVAFIFRSSNSFALMMVVYYTVCIILTIIIIIIVTITNAICMR